eukprot:tig00000980_g6160.t1
MNTAFAVQLPLQQARGASSPAASSPSVASSLAPQKRQAPSSSAEFRQFVRKTTFVPANARRFTARATVAAGRSAFSVVCEKMDELTDEQLAALIPDEDLPATYSPQQKMIRKRKMVEAMRKKTAPRSNFRIFVKGGAVNLTWATAGEKDNRGFIVERKAEGSDEFEVIGTYETRPELAGQGTTEKRTVYRFVDGAAVAGKTYLYRLSDCDTAGKSAPMATEAFEFDESAGEELEETDAAKALPVLAAVVAAFALLGFILFGQDFLFDLTRP